MSRLVRSESTNFDVVPQQVGIATYIVRLTSKELLLIVEARSPGQAAPDLYIFTHDVPQHVRRMLSPVSR